jgi:DNA-binding CsgD family transcriptional regulator
VTNPRILLETQAEVATAADAVERAGHRVLRTWHAPGQPWDLSTEQLFLCGTVASMGDARLALLAAARGAGVIAHVDDADETGGRFVDDLRRVGEIQRRPTSVRQGLGADELRLLDLLGAGSSIPEAAAALFISVRTAERRLAGSRRALGVTSTAEALRLVSRERAPR